MKTIALGVVFSIILSSLPAKVWACGFSLCPMESFEKEMPCHQQSNDQSSVENHSEAKCPCPDSELDAATFIEARSSLDFRDLSTSKAMTVEGFDFKHQCLSVFRNRPPPHLGLARLQIILQIFII